jgi:hypothetical protein
MVLRRIKETTGVLHREAESAYLITAGVQVHLPGWGRRAPAKPAIQVTPDSVAKPAIELTPTFLRLFHENTCPQYLRSLPRADRNGSSARSQRQGHLAGLGVGARVCQQLSGGEALVHKLRGPQRPKPTSIILTATEKKHKPTMTVVRWCAPQSGKFVLPLGYSRKSVRLLARRPLRARHRFAEFCPADSSG